MHAQFGRVLLAEELPTVAEHLETGRADILAFTVFPTETWRQIWSNDVKWRLNREIRGRTDVVGIFPDWPPRSGSSEPLSVTTRGVDRRPPYLGLDVLTRERAVLAEP